jgi:hypothetical protein
MRLVAVALPIVVILSPLLFRVYSVRPKCASVLVMLVVLFAVLGSCMEIVHRWGAWQNYANARQDVAKSLEALSRDPTEVALLDNAGVYFMYKAHFPRLANVGYLKRDFYQSPEIKTLPDGAASGGGNLIPIQDKSTRCSANETFCPVQADCLWDPFDVV